MKNKTPIVIVVSSLSLLGIGAALYFLVAPLFMETTATPNSNIKPGVKAVAKQRTVRIKLTPSRYYVQIMGHSEISLPTDTAKLQHVVSPYAHSTTRKYQFIVQSDKSMKPGDITSIITMLRSMGVKPVELVQ